MQLYFVPTKLPRTMSRKEWKECDRWRRVTQKKLAEEMQKKIDMLATFGTTELEQRMKRDIINEAIYPPLLLGPYMDTH